MKSLSQSFWLLALALLALGAAAPAMRAQAEQGEKKQETSVHTPKHIAPPLDIVVPIAPTAFKADGKWHLVYELHVTNLGRWDCLLTRLDVLNGDSAAAGTLGRSVLCLAHLGADSHSSAVTLAECKGLRNELFV